MKHSPSHILDDSIFPFNNSILLRCDGRKEFMFYACFFTKFLKTQAIKFASMITSYVLNSTSFLILNPFEQNSSLITSF